MLSEHIMLPSVGSLSVAVVALLMLIVQALFFLRKPQCTWYAWSAAVSFAAVVYAVGIFIEYNTPPGPLNRFSGLLEWTAVICLIHCLYGFTFSYLGIKTKRYHPVAGACHGLMLILLWFTPYLVADSFAARIFILLDAPYTEPALGPLGLLFVLYAVAASVTAMAIWIRHDKTDPKHRITYLAGIGGWILLGIHDGLAALGVPALLYVMEYGFLGFAVAVLWVVFSRYVELDTEERYRVITEFANDCILVIQEGDIVFGNPACRQMIGRPVTDATPGAFLDLIAPEDRDTVLERYTSLLAGGPVPDLHTVAIQRADGQQRYVEIASSLIRYKGRTAVLAVVRDVTERKRAEDELKKHSDHLEKLVTERTAELTRSNEQLQGQIEKQERTEQDLKRSQEQLRSLAKHLQCVREEERTAIARDIHDELWQSLTGLKMGLSWLSKRIPKDQQQLLDKLNAMSELTGSTLRTVQRISTELRPGLLNDLGLVAAIEWQTEEFQDRTGIQCMLTVDPEDISVDDRRSTALFRILQEVLTNVARHAQATRVQVSVKEEEGDLKLRIRDNGIGITKEQISDPKSFGITGIKERVYPWGGEATISGRPGKGTTVLVRMPVE
jgi:PAS domain S-box-containing protein